jgi:hypothetical protein
MLLIVFYLSPENLNKYVFITWGIKSLWRNLFVFQGKAVILHNNLKSICIIYN